MRGLAIAVAVGVIRMYQWVISPLFPSCCRYYPSCSEYAVQALKKYGVLKGSGKAVLRVLRCHPWAPGGYDPV